MSHKIHHTAGFVISGSNYGEANRYLFIFTDELGLVRASAQSLRKVSSKLRFSLQDFSYSKIDLVRGKEIWRVTNAKRISGYEAFNKTPAGLKMLANIFRLIKRLCHGEDPNPELFSCLQEIYVFLEHEKLTGEDIKNFEAVSVLKILHCLGYIGDGKDLSIFVSNSLSHSMLGEAKLARRVLIAEINKSLHESQL
jgi:DNA repair protein RecO (recombination protein O)